jgi:hypothetical protein
MNGSLKIPASLAQVEADWCPRRRGAFTMSCEACLSGSHKSGLDEWFALEAVDLFDDRSRRYPAIASVSSRLSLRYEHLAQAGGRCRIGF